VVPPLIAVLILLYTVTVLVAVPVHPEIFTEYVISDVPAATAVITPEEAPTVAIDEAELVHVPPVFVLVQFAIDPTHKGEVPVILCGMEDDTVTVFVAVFTQPLTVTEYVIKDVPADTPVTTPEEFIVATPTFPLVQVPPGLVLVSVVVVPEQRVVVPVIVCAVGVPIVTTTFPQADGVQEPL